MSSLTLNYGASDVRSNIAERVANALGYELAGREVLQTAAQTYNVPETKLSYVIHHGPSFFGMSDSTRKRYVAYILATAAQYLLKDNLVYHGPAGFFVAQGISHILKIRLISPLDRRIAFLMEKENLSREKAEQAVKRDEKDRKKWASKVFGLDDSDSRYYDENIEIDPSREDEIVDRIVAAARDRRYQSMTYSMQSMQNKELSYRIKAILYDIDPELRVRCESGNIFINTTAPGRSKDKTVTAIRDRLNEYADIKQVDVQVEDDTFKLKTGLLR